MNLAAYEHCWESMDFDSWISVILKFTQFRVRHSWKHLSGPDQDSLVSDVILKVIKHVRSEGRPTFKTATGWIRQVTRNAYLDALDKETRRGGEHTSLDGLEVDVLPRPSWRDWHANLPEPGSVSFFRRTTLNELLDSCRVSEGSEAIKRMVKFREYEFGVKETPVYTDATHHSRSNAVIRMRKELNAQFPDALELLLSIR